MTDVKASKTWSIGVALFSGFAVWFCAASCIYVTFVLEEIKALRGQISTQSSLYSDQGEVTNRHVLTKRSITQPPVTSKQRNNNEKKRKGKCKKCKRRRWKNRRCKKRCEIGHKGDKRLKGNIGLRGSKGETGQRGPSGGEGVKAAVHYATNFWKDVDIKEFGGDLSKKCIDKWEGTICRNRTFISKHDHQTMQFLNPVPWMKGMPSLLRTLEPGKFRAIKSGLYLVYLHVVFYDSVPREGVSIVQHRSTGNRPDTVLQCIEGHATARGIQNIKFKTCSITSMLHVSHNDTLEIKALYSGTVIDVTKDWTYFGAVLLAEQT